MEKGKILLISVVFCCVLVAGIIAYGVIDMVYAVNTSDTEEFDALMVESNFSLDKLLYKLEESSMVGQVRLDKGIVNLNIKENVLTINLDGKKLTYSNTFTLEGNTLKTMYFKDDDVDSITFDILEMVCSMVGYDECKIEEYVLNTDATLYNLQNVGLELKSGVLSMRLNKNIEYVDFKQMYISVSDASNYSKDLREDKLTVISNSNVTALRTGVAGKMVISVAEHEKLTEAAYDSLINVLAVATNYSEFYEEFMYSHSFAKLRNEEKIKYILEIDPEKEVYEKEKLGDKPMIRLTVFAE